jgi:hypothetical protein
MMRRNRRARRCDLFIVNRRNRRLAERKVRLVVESDAGRMTGRLGWRHFVGEDRCILSFVIQRYRHLGLLLLNLRLLLFLQLVNKVGQAFFMYRKKMIVTAKSQIIEAIFYTALSSCWGWTRSADALQIVLVMQTELPACGILHLLHNLYFDMIYGKTKTNRCERIVNRLYFILE